MFSEDSNGFCSLDTLRDGRVGGEFVLGEKKGGARQLGQPHGGLRGTPGNPMPCKTVPNIQ